ncbi:uncharacterized protein Tco025E_04278 [Trypanosoma conorhini]|uniref:Uncharacterized protein n=1 Tax=Trypanosoma conorhini TaxID=83891 RepID=A0A422PN16_9TRYP|nr:uncharacterized protein Tco025E_04278 [Trypanosoma conorhini]RNF19088.1 hypothetical protein Tco025E_04278 [Trypanosoma conorhini]
MQRGSPRLTPEGKALPSGSRGPALILMALFFMLFATSSRSGPSDELSTAITSFPGPTLLQQLASFAAMQAVAEEEQLDWGAPAALGREKTYRLRVQPREGTEGDHAGDDAAASSSSSNGRDAGWAHAPPHSRRRPHRRQRRRPKADGDSREEGVASPGIGSAKSCNGVSSSSSAGSNCGSIYTRERLGTSSTASHRVWAQLHMAEVAFSSRNNNLLHVTERFLNYEKMYPVIYRCHLRHLRAANEQALLDSPSTGLHNSRFWSCRSCGKAHNVVRASCERCQRHSGPYTKLIFDQLLPEPDNARSVLRLLHATHPEVTIHRIGMHSDVSGGRRSCVSVYVSADAAPELVAKLNGNVFFDLEEDGDAAATAEGGVRVHYVYSSQRPWLEAFINTRRAQCSKPEELPWGALVVLVDASSAKAKASDVTAVARAVPPRRKKKDCSVLVRNEA